MKTRTKIYGAVALTSMVAIYILLLASLLEILRIGGQAAAAFSAILLSMLAVFMASMLMLLLSSVDRLDQISQ